MKLIRFKVKGRFDFPVDMLRYDACWPADVEATSHMEYSFKEPSREGYEVTLAHWAANSNWEPTHGRWASFGWNVTEVLS